MTFIGEIAALFTSFCWTMSAVGFSNATRQFGSQVTNRLRVVLAMLALILINAVLYAKPIPFDAGLSRWGWLTISGIIGLAMGDAFLFSCYRHVGPRIGLLLLSLAPIFGAISAWLMFGETLTIMQILGIAVTLGGISWVVFARGEGSNESDHDWRKGLLLGVLAAFCQATGLVLSKQGMAGDFPPFAGTLIRMTAAILSNGRTAGAFGMAGGSPGLPGINRVERADGSVVTLGHIGSVEVGPGDVFVIETPGGGGYGAVSEDDRGLARQ